MIERCVPPPPTLGSTEPPYSPCPFPLARQIAVRCSGESSPHLAQFTVPKAGGHHHHLQTRCSEPDRLRGELCSRRQRAVPPPPASSWGEGHFPLSAFLPPSRETDSRGPAGPPRPPRPRCTPPQRARRSSLPRPGELHEGAGKLIDTEPIIFILFRWIFFICSRPGSAPPGGAPAPVGPEPSDPT